MKGRSDRRHRARGTWTADWNRHRRVGEDPRERPRPGDRRRGGSVEGNLHAAETVELGGEILGPPGDRHAEAVDSPKGRCSTGYPRMKTETVPD